MVFGGKLTSSTWGSIAKCLPDTALRDINDLPARDVLPKTNAGWRCAGQPLLLPSWSAVRTVTGFTSRN